MSDGDNAKTRARSAAQFIRDLHYNTLLRKGYAALFTKRNVSVSKFNEFLKTNGYTCKDTDFPDGWKLLCSQSLIGWQAIYQLAPNTSDGDHHTCMVVGSRTGKCRVLFDKKEIMGFTDGFKTKQSSISWKVDGSNSDRNCELEFKLKVVKGEPLDVRHIDAKIWKKDQTKPTEMTHSGKVIYSNIDQFDGTYATVISDPDSSDTDGDDIVVTGPAIRVIVDSGTTPKKITLKVQGSDQSFHTAANKVPCKEDIITWEAKDNDNNGDGTNKELSDAKTLPWINGWLNFSWTYAPPAKGAAYSMVQHARGASWKEKKNSQEISGYCKIDPSASSISPLPAEIAGYALTIGIFGLIGYKLVRSLVALFKFAKKKSANDEIRDGGKIVSTQDEIEENSLRQALDDTLDILSPAVSDIDIIDTQDTSTFRRQLNDQGEKVFSHSGGEVYVNELDPSGSTALANFTKEGDKTVYKEVVQKDGTQFKAVSDYPTISSPIKNIKTQENMTVREIGKTFTHTVSIDANTKVEEALRGNGEPLEEFPEEPLHEV